MTSKEAAHYGLRRLGPNRTKILGAILAADGLPPTVRGLMELIGFRSPNAIQRHIDVLSELGLIRRERQRARTLVPTCRFISAADLFDERSA